MRTRNQKGLTLIELLAVISISSIVLLVAYSILTSMIVTNSNSTSKTNLRNEAVTISQHIENIMLNVDSIQINGTKDANGQFQSFTAVDTRRTETSPGKFTESSINNTFDITNGNLLINGSSMNSASYSFQNTTFKLLDASTLQVNYVILDPKTKQSFKLFKVYKLQGG